MFKKFGYAAAFTAVIALAACKKVEEVPNTEVVATEVPSDATVVEVPADEAEAANTSAKN